MITDRNSFVEMVIEAFDEETIWNYYHVTVEELQKGAWNRSLEYGYDTLKTEQDYALGLI